MDFKFIEPSTPLVYVPISNGDTHFVIPVFSSDVPSEPDEVDNSSSLGGIDTDGDGIKDDVERWIALKFPKDAKKRRYSYSYAFYMRKLLMTTNRTQIQNNVIELIKASVCMPSNEKELAEIMGMHLNSETRFNRYAENAASLSTSMLEVNALACVL